MIAVSLTPPLQQMYVVTVEVPGNPGVDIALLKAALRRLIDRARKFPPDGRFDWSRVVIGDVSEREI